MIVFRADLHYPQFFPEECLSKLGILECRTIDVSKGMDVNNIIGFRECITCNYGYSLRINFRFDPKKCMH